MSQLQSCSSRSSSSSLLLPRQAQTATLRPVCAAATTTISRRRGIISRAAVSRSCRSRALVVRPQAEFGLYADNPKRDARAKELLNQCVEFQARMFKAKEELEAAAKEANDAIYEAFRKVEPDAATSESAEDWNRQIDLSDLELRKIDWITKGVETGGGVASLFVGARVYKNLADLLGTVNYFQKAGQAVETAGAEGVAEALALGASETAAKEAGERAALSAARSVAPEVLEVAGLEASEVTLTLVGRVLAGGGALVASVAAFVVADLIVESITGAVKRSHLREVIHKAYPARQRLKLLDMQYEQLREELAGVVNAFKVVSSPALLGVMTKEKLTELANNIVEQHASKLDAITPEAAAVALAGLDMRMASWTNEDKEDVDE